MGALLSSKCTDSSDGSFGESESCSFSCGIDSIPSVDKKINQILLQPPRTPHHLISGLHRGDIRLSLVPCGDGPGISMIQVGDVNTDRKCVIFSHGNGCDIYTMLPYFRYLHNTFGVAVVGYDYPGYGLSLGKTTEAGCYESIRVVVDRVVNVLRIDPMRIIMMAESLGTGVLINYAATHTWPYPIILVSPYKSIPRILTDKAIIESCVSNYKFRSFDLIDRLTCPVKIFHSKSDTLIHYSHAQDLYSKLQNKSLPITWLEGVAHEVMLQYISNKDLGKFLS